MRNEGFLELLDYRRQVRDLYARLRSMSSDPARAHLEFREARDSLFAHHPQSPLTSDQKAQFEGLRYYPYDPSWRCLAELDFEVEPNTLSVELDQDGALEMARIARARFRARNANVELTVYWLLGYGGGLFLPFRDNTNKDLTYGGGRYLIDTIKGADLGGGERHLILDFNFSYNPSCAYNPSWHCPLAPPENWLNLSIAAGEQRYPGAMPRVQQREPP